MQLHRKLRHKWFQILFLKVLSGGLTTDMRTESTEYWNITSISRPKKNGVDWDKNHIIRSNDITFYRVALRLYKKFRWQFLLALF